MKAKSGEARVAVNGVEWSVKESRKEIPCTKCQTPTKGRIGTKPMCTDCGIATAMKPIGDFRDRLRALLAPKGSLLK